MKFLFTLCLLFCSGSQAALHAQSYNNYQKEYTLKSVTEAKTESQRTHRMIICDHQPSGLYIRKGETLTFTVRDLQADYRLEAMIGFKPTWGSHNTNQVAVLQNGTNTVLANQEGVLFFTFVKSSGYDFNPTYVKVSVKGGKAFPLFYVNRSNLANWQNDLRTMTDAPFVQLVSDLALVTIPYQAYMKNPAQNLYSTFKAMHQVIDGEDDLAGFDHSSTENIRTNNRVHYLVDVFATEEDRKRYYMYATGYLVGIKDNNFQELTDPKLLREGWGIWHETGHTQQQRSWTWGSITEISVNPFSLYVQQKFQKPSRLSLVESAEHLTPMERAKAYLALPEKDFMVNDPTHYNVLFTKLVMFHQLQKAYGWDVMRKLYQYFRKTPFDYSAPGLSDQQKADRFMYAMCVVTENNLLPFFRKWGFKTSPELVAKVSQHRFRLPSRDPSLIFQE